MSDSVLNRRLASKVDTLPLHQEHQLLIRMVAALQSRVTDLVQTHLMAQRTLEAEILRLRARAMVDHTRRLWAVPRPPATRRDRTAPATETDDRDPSRWRAANAVLCQTGCVGHAHPWLQVDGECSRTGRACTELHPTHSTHTSLDPDCTFNING